MRRPVPLAIFAGGKSVRFGRDKALASWNGATMLQGVARVAAALPARVFVVADKPGKYAGEGLHTVADTQPYLGPLGGLATALATAAPEPHVIVLACDFIGIETEWLAQLRDADAGAPIVMFDATPQQPLVARYSTALCYAAECALASGERALHRFIARQESLRLPCPSGWSKLRNINAPSDFPIDPGVTVP